MRIGERQPRTPAASPAARPPAPARKQLAVPAPAPRALPPTGPKLSMDAPPATTPQDQAFFGLRAAQAEPLASVDRVQVQALRDTFRDRVLELEKLPSADATGRAPELLELAEQVIASRGGRSRRVTLSDGRAALEIEPNRRWYLGRLAQGLQRRFDHHLVYCPDYLLASHSVGAVDAAGHQFLVPHDAILSEGPADPIRPLDNVAHEVHHIYLNGRTGSGDQPLFEGKALALKDKQILGDPALYKSYISFQEASTFSLQAALVANQLRKLVLEGALQPDADRLTQFEVKNLTYKLGTLTENGQLASSKVALNAGVARRVLEKDASALRLWPRLPEQPPSIPLRQAAVPLADCTIVVPILRPDLAQLFDAAKGGDEAARTRLAEAVVENLNGIEAAASKESSTLSIATQALKGLGFEMPSAEQLHTAVACTKLARRGVMAAEAAFAKAQAD